MTILKRLNIIKRYLNLTKLVYIGILLGILLDYLLLLLFPKIIVLVNSTEGIPRFVDIGYFLFTVILICLPLIFIILFLKRSVERGSKFLVISHSFIGVILMFAFLYFSFCVTGDFKDQLNKDHFYQSGLIHKKYFDTNYQFVRKMDIRPFKGISHKLWTGVDNPDYEIFYKLIENDNKLKYNSYIFLQGYVEEVPLEICIKISEMKLPGNILYRLQPENYKPVFLDCLYFSVITITTLGYGDIVPSRWYSKLTVIFEVLCGLVILGYAINLYFANYKKILKDL